MQSSNTRLETEIIFDWIAAGSSVLDLGCGDGDLLYRLAKEKGCRVQGIEIEEEAIYRCVEKGLSVLHDDIDSGLPEYGDNSFDYVVLNQSFQQVKRPEAVLREALRVGRETIVSFPNFAYCSARFQMFFLGRTPVTPSLPHEWHDTPNLHFLSISDFTGFCSRRRIKVEQAAFAAGGRKVWLFPNLLASTGIFRISNGARGV
jgi:methionine biosynthesis protein MetW